jgi:hypothetical protein
MNALVIFFGVPIMLTFLLALGKLAGKNIDWDEVLSPIIVVVLLSAVAIWFRVGVKLLIGLY